ncbi:hypothetical protein CPT_Machias_186 [Staphylococcus phage Machias]|nr:hypothetical protein CPT_Machias_186 [Staphylococcus phage Machias]WPH64282.1 hypothetical protein [Staphylococcus phage vB_StaM_PB50]
MELERKHLLNEDAMSQKVLQEFSLPFRPFKRLSPEEQVEALGLSVAKMSDKLLKKSGNKNLKSILSSKGDFKKIKAYKDFEKTFNYIKAQKSKGFDKTLIFAFDTIENSVKLLEKEKQNFKKCFTNDNEVGQLTYTTIAASVMSATVQLFFLGFEKDLNGNLKFTDKKLSKKDSIELKTLDNLLKTYKAGKLKEIFKIDGSFVSTNEEFDFKKLADDASEAYKDGALGTIMNKLKSLNKGTKVAAGGILVIALAPMVLLMIKQAYIYFIKKRSDFAEYLRDAVSIIEGEKDNDISDSARKKQEKMAERLNKLADKIDIEDGVAEVQSRSESESIDVEIGKELENDFNIRF